MSKENTNTAVLEILQSEINADKNIKQDLSAVNRGDFEIGKSTLLHQFDQRLNPYAPVFVPRAHATASVITMNKIISESEYHASYGPEYDCIWKESAISREDNNEGNKEDITMNNIVEQPLEVSNVAHIESPMMSLLTENAPVVVDSAAKISTETAISPCIVDPIIAPELEQVKKQKKRKYAMKYLRKYNDSDDDDSCLSCCSIL